MPKAVYLYLLTVPVFFAIDLVWIGVVANKFYAKNLGALLRTPPDWTVAIAFYLLYIFGIVVLVVLPAAQSGSLVEAAWRGALFGLVAYATYDLTNLSTTTGWPAIVSYVDMTWGTVLTGSVSSLSFLIARWLGIGS